MLGNLESCEQMNHGFCDGLERIAIYEQSRFAAGNRIQHTAGLTANHWHATCPDFCELDIHGIKSGQGKKPACTVPDEDHSGMRSLTKKEKKYTRYVHLENR